MKVTDIAIACAPHLKQDVIGIRPGEKIHEQMIGIEDAPYTYEYLEYFKILPSIYNWNKDPNRFKEGILVSKDFSYCSNNNIDWMTIDQMRSWIALNQKNNKSI